MIPGEILPPYIPGEVQVRGAKTYLGRVALADIEKRNPIERLADVVSTIIDRLPFASLLTQVSYRADDSAAKASPDRRNHDTGYYMPVPDNWVSLRRS